MTEAIYLEVSEKTEAAKKAGRRVSVSGMLKFLGVSRSGYLAWLHHVPSDTEKRREAVKAKIQDIYDDSKQNYGAPKITVEIRKTGEVISERTVGTYMRQMSSQIKLSFAFLSNFPLVSNSRQVEAVKFSLTTSIFFRSSCCSKIFTFDT